MSDARRWNEVIQLCPDEWESDRYISFEPPEMAEDLLDEDKDEESFLDDDHPGPGPDYYERQRAMRIFRREQARKKVEFRDEVKGALLGSRLLDAMWDKADIVRLARGLLDVYKDGCDSNTGLVGNLMRAIAGAESQDIAPDDIMGELERVLKEYIDGPFFAMDVDELCRRRRVRLNEHDIDAYLREVRGVARDVVCLNCDGRRRLPCICRRGTPERIRSPRECRNCKGSGIEECPGCRGRGYVARISP